MNDNEPIKILLVDDHALFRGGLRSLLQRQIDFDIVGEAADGLEGVKLASQLQPDVVLLLTAFLSKGNNAISASFNDCSPKGIPIMVTIISKLATRYSILVIMPPQISQIRLPKNFISYGY